MQVNIRNSHDIVYLNLQKFFDKVQNKRLFHKLNVVDMPDKIKKAF